MANDSYNPQLSAAVNSPLETLARQALRRYGDNAAGVVEAEALLMFIELANLVVDDFRMHPYGTSLDHLIDYYHSLQDARAIPDNIMIQGLLFQYSLQQASDRAQVYTGLYYQTLNREMLRRKDGKPLMIGIIHIIKLREPAKKPKKVIGFSIKLFAKYASRSI